MKVKTSELTGAALDWAVGVAICKPNHIESKFQDDESGCARVAYWCSVQYSTDWAQGGPLVDEFKVGIEQSEPKVYAYMPNFGIDGSFGDTALIAICRALVTRKSGEEVDIPDYLI